LAAGYSPATGSSSDGAVENVEHFAAGDDNDVALPVHDALAGTEPCYRTVVLVAVAGLR
jgi:hypothetical protein